MPGTIFDIDVIAAADLEVMSVADGENIYARGDDGHHAYIVSSGAVEIRCVEHVVEVISPGEIFGGLTLLDNQPRACSAVAAGNVELIAINRSLFEALLRDDPEFAQTVMQLVVRRLRAAFRMLDQPAAGTPVEPAAIPFPPSRASA
jgi:CRP/FNR family transcriptional regulator